jgi:hypothetical protein
MTNVPRPKPRIPELHEVDDALAFNGPGGNWQL